MSKRHILLIALKRVGAFKKQHNRKMGLTLGEHLTNTYDDLRRMGADEEVALAGGLHSVYGTNSFRERTIPIDQRAVLQQLFGVRAERLAWLFCTINRPQCFEGEPIKNWRTGDPVDVTEDELRDLKLIEVANLGDNGVNLSKFPTLSRFYDEHRAAS